MEQAGVAGSKVVQRKPDAAGLEVGGGEGGAVQVVEQGAFGNFDGEALEVEFGGVRETMQQAGQSAVVQLAGRKIDGEADIGGQKACRGERLLEQRDRHAVHEAVPFDGGDEIAGVDQVARGMLPARKDLETADVALAEVDQRLEVR